MFMAGTSPDASQHDRQAPHLRLPACWHPAVKSMAHSGDCVWVGMDDGRINVLHLSDGSLVK